MVGMATKSDFAARLKRAREKLAPKVTQAEMAEALRVPLRTYQNWEQGHAVPPEYVQTLVLKAVREHS